VPRQIDLKRLTATFGNRQMLRDRFHESILSHPNPRYEGTIPSAHDAAASGFWTPAGAINTTKSLEMWDSLSCVLSMIDGSDVEVLFPI